MAGAEQWLNEGLDKAHRGGQKWCWWGRAQAIPGLLTLKALQQIQQAEVVLWRPAGLPEILDPVRRDATLVSVGKKAVPTACPRKRPTASWWNMPKRATGWCASRGSFFMFGRGGEELEVLAEEGIPFSVVPGITAAAGATAYAGIPLTHRDHAQSAVFITGHCQKEGKEPDWQQLGPPIRPWSSTWG